MSVPTFDQKSPKLNTFKFINPIQTGLFLPSLDWRGGGGGGASNAPTPPPPPPPNRCLKLIKDIDMKLTPLIKRREINLLLLSYLSCDVT